MKQTQTWQPGETVEVECEHCGYQWSYSGMTPYAQCPDCQRSNNLMEQL